MKEGGRGEHGVSEGSNGVVGREGRREGREGDTRALYTRLSSSCPQQTVNLLYCLCVLCNMCILLN